MNQQVVVIGAGVDELVVALALAKAGRTVTMLVQQADAAPPATEGWLLPALVRELDLERHGLRVERPDPWIEVPLPGGKRLQLWQDLQRSVDSLRALSAADAAAWPGFCAQLRTVSGVLERLYSAPPPQPMAHERRELLQLLALGWGLRRLGRPGIETLARVLPMPVADLLDDHFQSDALKAVLGAAGVWDTQHGPRSAGTALGLAHRHAGHAPGVFRPARSNAGAVLRSLAESEAGISLRREAAAAIEASAGRARGVRLAGGETLPADIVVCGLDPRRTLLELVDPGWIDPELQRALRHVRARGVTARVEVSLPRAANFHRLSLGASLDALERAYDDAKYGRLSAAPYLEAITQPQAIAQPRAGAAQRVSVHVQYAPYALRDGEWDESRRRALGEEVLRRLAGAAPELAGAKLDRVWTPPELERACGWPQGQAQQAELALDQFLWMRPVPALARYRAPLDGLYLCGPAMHPGAGVPGAAGFHAAGTILRDT